MTDDSAPAFRLITHGNVHVIHFTIKVSDRLVVERLNQQIHALLEQESSKPRFVIDFVDVKEMSSAILGVLMSINLKIYRKGGVLRLCGIRHELAEMLTLMKLDTILKIDETVEQSLERIG